MVLLALGVATSAMLEVIPKSFAQDAAANVDALSGYAAPELTREEWRQRVDAARQRAREIALERRKNSELRRWFDDEGERIASERVLTDDSLVSGDIVATRNGLFIFRGRQDSVRRPDDFVAIKRR